MRGICHWKSRSQTQIDRVLLNDSTAPAEVNIRIFPPFPLPPYNIGSAIIDNATIDPLTILIIMYLLCMAKSISNLISHYLSLQTLYAVTDLSFISDTWYDNIGAEKNGSRLSPKLHMRASLLFSLSLSLRLSGSACKRRAQVWLRDRGGVAIRKSVAFVEDYV
jgi:hypothetical protein